MQIIESNSLEDNVTPETQSIEIGNLYYKLGVVDGCEQLPGFPVVEFYVMRLCGAHTPGKINPANFSTNAVPGKRRLYLSEDKAVDSSGTNVIETGDRTHKENKQNDGPCGQ